MQFTDDRVGHASAPKTVGMLERALPHMNRHSTRRQKAWQVPGNSLRILILLNLLPNTNLEKLFLKSMNSILSGKLTGKWFSNEE